MIESYTPVAEHYAPSENKYAVGILVKGGIMAMLQKYSTRDELAIGYQEWRQFAMARRLPVPFPIGILDSRGNCMILDDLLVESQN